MTFLFLADFNLFSAEAWALIWKFKDVFLNGLIVTVEIAVVALALSLLLGFLFGLMATSETKLFRAISRVYIEFFQNTPVMLQVCFLFYVLSFSGVNAPAIAIGMIGLGIYQGAYMAEAVRAGIEAIPKGQAEAAASQGFGYAQTMLYVVLPQTTKIMLPPMVNQIVALIKNTSCMYIIGGTDLITATYNFVKGEATGGAYGPAFLISALLFFLMCFPLSYLASNWEKKLKKRETQELLIRQPLAQRSAFGNSLIAEEKQNPIKRFTERRETDGRISR